MENSSKPEKDHVEIFMPPHPIANKVTVADKPMSKAEFERTEANLRANFGGHYMEWLKEDMLHLERAFAGLTGEGARDALEQTRVRVHEMRAMGGTFDFSLVTAICDQMYRLVSELDEIERDRLAALKVHYDALKLVVAEDLRGDGGERGQAILIGLRQVYAKYA